MAAARAFYCDVLGFEETFEATHGQWIRLRRDDMEIALWEAQGDEGGVASVDVADVRAEVDRHGPAPSAAVRRAFGRSPGLPT